MNNKTKVLFTLALLLFSLFSLYGCSYLEAKKIPIGAKSSEYEGFPFYMKKPLLVVNNTAVNVIWVDDRTNLWAIKVGAVLAKNKSAIELGNSGAPSKINADLEDDAIALKFLDLASSALQETLKAKLLGDTATGSGETGKFQIFDFEYDNDGNITRLKPLITKELYNTMIDVKPMPTVGGNSPNVGGVTPDNGQPDAKNKPNPNPNPNPPANK